MMPCPARGRIHKITTQDAAAASGSLMIMLVGAAITLPAIFRYSIYTYGIFRDKTSELTY